MGYKEERIGISKINNQGLRMQIVDYITNKNMIVKFDDGTIVKARWIDFNKGYTSNPNYPRGDSPKKERIGEENVNHQGCKMKIIEYVSARKIIVQFNDDSKQIVETNYRYFKTGITHNPFIPTVYGVGILGNECPSSEKEGGKKEYMAWKTMLERCYSPQRQEKWPTYKLCTVSDEFKYYPNFYKWLINQENYNAWKNNKNFNVDKDIICKGNKEYSPNKCCLVPNRINNLIKISKRSNNLLGVKFDEATKKYIVTCKDSLRGKTVYLGSFDSEYEAFLQYKTYKENLLKEIAEKEYADGMISKQCKEALMNYKIEITD